MVPTSPASSPSVGTAVVSTTRSCSLLIIVQLFGYAVTKRGISPPLIDNPDCPGTDRTLGIWPLGVSIRPSTIYFRPCRDSRHLAAGHSAASLRNAAARVSQLSRLKPNEKKWCFAGVVWVRGIQQVIRNLFPLDDQQVWIGQFHGKISVCPDHGCRNRKKRDWSLQGFVRT